MFSVLLGFVGRHAQPLLIAALVAAGAALVWNGVQLKFTERKLEREQEARQKAERDFDELVRDYNEQARMADARERAKEQEHVATTRKIADDLGAKLADKDRSLRAALDGLRHSADEARRRALLPRETAPAPCRDHAASPTQLAVPDAELALGIAADGDRAAVRLDAAQRYIREICRPEGVTP